MSLAQRIAQAEANKQPKQLRPIAPWAAKLWDAKQEADAGLIRRIAVKEIAR
jgi:hypothetical protein